MMNVNVVTFDLDGTLVNTLPAIAKAFNEILKKYSYKTFEEKKYMEVLNDVACYKHDGYGLKGIERFVNFAMKGEYHDECKCCNV